MAPAALLQRRSTMTVRRSSGGRDVLLHLRHHCLWRFLSPEEEQAKKDPRYNLKLINNEAKSALEELDREYTPSPYLVGLPHCSMS